MSDLISRQSVIDLLKKSASRDIEEVVITDKHINLIKDMPCAYDVEKVVAELEEEKSDFGEKTGYFKGIDKAIDIVKAGGIDG